MGLLLFVWFGLTCGGIVLLIWLLASLSGTLGVLLGFAVLLVGLSALLWIGRALRHAVTPLGDVMEAASQVAEGDYAVRVTERGPREMRALARAFNAMTTRLQSNEEQRRDMLADITHELRTPLTVIQGNLEGILDGIYPADQAHLEPVLEETQELARVIDDLRTLALAEGGAVKLQRKPTNIDALIREAVASFRAQADAAGIALNVEVAPDLPTLEVDPARIREVLVNLIANALRYTPREGRTEVKCSAIEHDSHVVTISVSDTGPGIAPEDLPHIFDRFHKSADSRGMGLGLTIAKNLVAAHGGEIRAKSDLGNATPITFTLPR